MLTVAWWTCEVAHHVFYNLVGLVIACLTHKTTQHSLSQHSIFRLDWTSHCMKIVHNHLAFCVWWLILIKWIQYCSGYCPWFFWNANIVCFQGVGYSCRKQPTIKVVQPILWGGGNGYLVHLTLPRSESKQVHSVVGWERNPPHWPLVWTQLPYSATAHSGPCNLDANFSERSRIKSSGEPYIRMNWFPG